MAPKAKNLAGAAERAHNIVALLEHKPGPGIYSRLERAVQQLPENVRVQELPGLLKRYKDGIPGWELKAVDFDSVVAGRTTVPRDELLTAVRERSPVFTTREVRLSENAPAAQFFPPRHRTPDHILLPALESLSAADNLGFDSPQEALAAARSYPDWRNRWEMTDQEAAPVNRYLEYHRQRQAEKAAPRAEIGGIGAETPHGPTRFHDYKPDGATNYTELVFLQPNAAPEGVSPPVSWMPDVQHHWHEAYPMPWRAPQDVKNATTRDAVAHMRFAEQGDALRLLESQSDAHNRNIRAAKSGVEERPYALEQVQSEIDVKRLLLEAARQGKNAVEIASPEFVHETVGMPLEHAQHRYGKVLPSEMERAGRKVGDFIATERPATAAASGVVSSPTDRWRVLNDQADAVRMRSLKTQQLIRELVEQRALMGIGDAALPDVPLAVRRELDHSIQTIGWLPTGADALLQSQANDLRRAVASYIGSRRGNRSSVIDNFTQADQIMPEVMKRIEDMRELSESYDRLNEQSTQAFNQARQQGPAPGWRGVISDEMRKRIINQGIPAAIAIGVGTGVATGGNQAEAKPVSGKRLAGGFIEAPMMPNGLREPGPTEAQLIRSLISKGERQQVNKLTSQAEDAYARGDFAAAEDFDARREELLEAIENRIAQTTEDMDADFSDYEPNDFEGDLRNYEEQMRDIYGSYVAGGPHYMNEAQLADALRGVGRDTETANKISDEDIIREAKAAFDNRQGHREKLRSASPEDGVRAMQAQLRDMGAAAFPAPIMAQAQSVNERRDLPTGSGGSWDDIRRSLTGEFDYSMSISPAEWEAHYQKGASPEHQKFKNNVVEVMGQPIIRVGAAKETGVSLVDGEDFDRITPAQFVGEYLDRYAGRLDNASRAQVLDRVVAKLNGSTQSPDVMADDIVNRMLGALKESSPKGKFAKVDPMPQEQLDALKKQHGDWAESMLTPGTAENFESLRGYELLRTTMEGEHAPVYADSLSNAAAFIGGFVDPKSRENFGDSMLSSGPEGRFRRANRDYFSSRTRTDEPAAFRDPDGTSRFASTSATNIPGLLRAGGDVSNPIGAMSWKLYDPFAEFTRTNTGKFLTGQVVEQGGPSDWDFVVAKRQAFDREQPILPAGMTREEFDHQFKSHQKDREQGIAWGATTYPNVQQAFDNVTGLKTQKTWGPPVYNDYGPNFLQNTVGNIPSAGIMAASAATGGLAGLAAGAFKPAGSSVRALVNAGLGIGKGAVKGAGSAAASQAKDIPFDFATDQGVGSALGGGVQNYLGYISTPEQENALLPGVNPDSMSIDELNDRRNNAMYDRDKAFRDNKWNWFNRPKSSQQRAYDEWRSSQ